MYLFYEHLLLMPHHTTYALPQSGVVQAFEPKVKKDFDVLYTGTCQIRSCLIQLLLTALPRTHFFLCHIHTVTINKQDYYPVRLRTPTDLNGMHYTEKKGTDPFCTNQPNTDILT